MSKRRREAKFQNEIDLNKVYCEKKPVKGLLPGCLSSVSGGIHFRQRSVVGVLCSSLLLTGASGIMPGKATTVVYAADIEKYTNADFAMDTVVSETLYTSGEDINIQIGEKLRLL